MIDLQAGALEVAPALLGAVLEHDGVAVRLTEVEAYLGTDDPASHAFRGPTPRTRVMFGPASHLYVYLSYGMHVAANIVCGPDGEAAAVLLRAGEVVGGIELARERRQRARRSTTPVPDAQLARGPGCLGQALGLSVADSGSTISQDGTPAPFHLTGGAGEGVVLSGPRVGVSQAADDAYRFWLDGEASVSRYSRSPRAPRLG